MRRGIVARNVAHAVKAPRQPHNEMQVWTADEVRLFLPVAATSIYAPVWHVALLTGMRRGELLGLRWQDVDFTRGVLSVRQAIGPLANKPFAQPPKSGKARVIDLDTQSLQLLRQHRVRQSEARLAAGSSYYNQDLVFASATGTSINPPNLWREFKALRERAGISRIRIHDLRHTAATLMLVAGVPVKVVSERLGHASVSITLDLYAHVIAGMGKDAAEALWRVISDPESQKFSQKFAE